MAKVKKVSEDGEAASLDSVPGMGTPSLPARGADGSGDVPSTPKKKKRKRILKFNDFK